MLWPPPSVGAEFCTLSAALGCPNSDRAGAFTAFSTLLWALANSVLRYAVAPVFNRLTNSS
ncbi:Uncharacterised protein [Mycobacterium tuberculosis]|nr:Uncharacterised protein [Mycobacterium tuberculosis]COY05623.1 Uncharacterised protein [Mycobacterium tuberculosis]